MGMIRELFSSDFEVVLQVVNDGAQAYKGVIPDDVREEPYMLAEELKREIASGVRFYGWMEDGIVVGVMGIQPVREVTLIRHAYVLTGYQKKGIGGKLLEHLLGLAGTEEVLVGTWEKAVWAIRFYEKHGFRQVPREEKDRLLRRYWNISERQIETSVVLRLVRGQEHGVREAI